MSRQVFVVEDDALISMELQCRLRDLGYGVCGTASRGQEALRAIPASAPDVILMDVNLGPGIDGVDVAILLQDQYPVPVIFVTAYSRLADRDPRARGFPVIVKPFAIEELRRVLADAALGGEAP